MLGASRLWAADLARCPLRSAPAPRPHGPAPRSAHAQVFSGMSAHRSAPAHPIFCPLRSVFRSAQCSGGLSNFHTQRHIPVYAISYKQAQPYDYRKQLPLARRRSYEYVRVGHSQRQRPQHSRRPLSRRTRSSSRSATCYRRPALSSQLHPHPSRGFVAVKSI